MRRLFFSLYLAVTCGLVLISWSSEFLWRQLQTERGQNTSVELETMRALLKPYKALLLNRQIREQDLVAQGVPTTIITSDTLAFLPEQQQALLAGELVYMFDLKGRVYFYHRLSDTRLVKYGPLNLTREPDNEPWLKTSLLLLSYGLLALFILLWSRPLWRDLNILRRQTEQFSQGQLDLTHKVRSHSVIYPLAQAFTAMAKRIQELLTLQKQMTHAVSHDIRTPLARLKFSLALLNPDATKLLNVKREMTQDIQEIEQLIDEILVYGRLESTESPIRLQTVNLSELVQNLVEKLNRHAAIKIDVTCPASILFTCDGHLVERALQNLLINAQRHAKSRIELSIAANNSALNLSVADDGEGVPVEDKERIFDPFTRLEQSRNKTSGGFGLGLAIVKKIVAWHQGQICVLQSDIGGAKFEIQLPAPRQSASDEP